MKLLLNIVFLLLFTISLKGQDWTQKKIINNGWDIKNNSLDSKKLEQLIFTEVALYSSAIYSLDKLWYSNYPRSKFHFINDNNEWLQMDKLGHLTTSYYLGITGINSYRWTGMKEKRAIWYGGLTGSFFLTAIEFLDGTSEEWGASSGDLIANTTGSLFAIFQELYWKEQKILLKFSYFPSKWAQFNTKQLGENHIQRLLKDYNGQTYWMSFNLKSLLHINSLNFPNYLNFAIGYSGNNMIYPYPNDGDNRYRQYLFSFDIDLTKIKTNNKFLNTMCKTFGFIKFPMPTLEFSNGKFITHSIY